jgi:hypothetical protein
VIFRGVESGGVMNYILINKFMKGTWGSPTEIGYDFVGGTRTEFTKISLKLNLFEVVC